MIKTILGKGFDFIQGVIKKPLFISKITVKGEYSISEAMDKDPMLTYTDKAIITSIVNHLGLSSSDKCRVLYDSLSGYDLNHFSGEGGAYTDVFYIQECLSKFFLRCDSNETEAHVLSNETSIEDREKHASLFHAPVSPVLSSDSVNESSFFDTNNGGDPLDFSFDEGLWGYKPVDVNNSFHKGFLYYPVQTILSKVEYKNGDPYIAEKVETVVIRSDRTLQRIIKSKKLNEGDIGHDVLRLTDGTLIHTPPKPNNHGTWYWSYIQAFLKGEEMSPTWSLNDCLWLIYKHLRSRVFLPSEDDYWLLSLTTIVTYVQSIFDSVPLIMLLGPAGTGKSELGIAMSEVSSNATMIGQSTAATIMRLINESGGLCIIDDLESVGAGGKNNSGGRKFNEVSQVLKVSYKKSTATKMITNPQTGRTEVMNFFGVKIVSNTQGADDILGSRMLHIHTKHMDEEDSHDFSKRSSLSDSDLSHLRNRLHTWAFENVSSIKSVYDNMSKKTGNREEEITLPLQVIASMSGDKDIKKSLDKAIVHQSNRKRLNTDPDLVISEAVDNLKQEGACEASIEEIKNELRRILTPGYSKVDDKDFPEWLCSEWVGRKLRTLNLVKSEKRKRVGGKNLRFVVF